MRRGPGIQRKTRRRHANNEGAFGNLLLDPRRPLASRSNFFLARFQHDVEDDELSEVIAPTATNTWVEQTLSSLAFAQGFAAIG